MIFRHYDQSAFPPLHRAACAGDITELTHILDAGGDSEAVHDLYDAQYAPIRGSVTPLMVAAGSENGSAVCVEVLLARGADPRRRSAAGVDALWYAASSGDPARVSALLGHSDITAAAGGQTVVAIAARHGSVACLRLLLQAGGSPHAVGGLGSEADVRGVAIPIFAAAAAGSAACVQMLLDLGALPDACDADGRTPLMFASASEVVAPLVAAGCPVNGGDTQGATALMLALQRHHVIEGATWRAYPQIIDSRELAPHVTRRQLDVIGALLDAGAQGDARDANGQTALLAACMMSDAVPALIAFLHARGMDLQARDSEGRTALHAAARSSNSPPALGAIMAQLLGAGLSVDVRDHRGRTPLHLAADKEHGDRGALALLLGLGARVDARDTDGATPLILAAHAPERHFGTVRRLLAAGAEVQVPTDGGITARMAAAARVAALEQELAIPEHDSGFTITMGDAFPIAADPARAAYAAAERRMTLHIARATQRLMDRARDSSAPTGPPQALPGPIWLGYRPVDPVAPPAYWAGNPDLDHIAQICNFGHGISGGEATNAAVCSPTPEVFHAERATWGALAGDTPEVLYAYRAYPMRFNDAGQTQIIAADTLLGDHAVAPRPPDLSRFTRIGYDIKECTGNSFWGLGCAPLSPRCNGMAAGMGALINQWCLVDDLASAYDLAIMFGISKPEPGPYVSVEVWQPRATEASTTA